MDSEHLLQDVFDTALRILKEGRTPPGQADLQRVLKEAMEETIQHEMNRVTGEIRSKHRQLYQMLEEWDRTRKPVKTRWASTDDPWKA